MNHKEPLPVELLVSSHSRRLSVDAHDHFRRCIATDQRGVDEIDRNIGDDFDDMIEIDPYVSGTNNRRSDKELNRMLNLIDNLPISTNGKDGQA